MRQPSAPPRVLCNTARRSPARNALCAGGHGCISTAASWLSFSGEAFPGHTPAGPHTNASESYDCDAATHFASLTVGAVVVFCRRAPVRGDRNGLGTHVQRPRDLRRRNRLLYDSRYLAVDIKDAMGTPPPSIHNKQKGRHRYLILRRRSVWPY